MNKQDYLDGMREIHKESTKKQNELSVKYALSNSTIKVGDIVESKHTIVIVDRIQATFGVYSNIPECVYKGEQLTKHYKPRKDGNKSRVYQSDLFKVNKKIVNIGK